ncbi:MAG: Ku protein [Phycisphaerales bacterium]
MRAIWKGRITFGQAVIPVKLYTAVNDIRSHSHLLHDQDKQRLEQKLVCVAQDSVIDRDDTIRGFEINKGQYVLVEPEELEKFEPEKSTEIEITEFVDSGKIDSRYIAKTYYLGPDNDNQMFVNLTESLKKTKLAGICRWSMRKKSYLGILEVSDDILQLIIHRSADQVLPEDSFELENVKISAKEKEIAKKLIVELQGEFNPQEYHDEYQAKLKDLIERKAKGKTVKLPALKKQKETSDKDLLNALEKSFKAISASK